MPHPLAPLWEALEDDDWDVEDDRPEEYSPPGSPAPTVTAAPTITPFPEVAADISVELLIDGTWTDVTADPDGTSLVYSRDAISIGRGRANEASLADFSRCGVTFNNRDGRFSPRNPRSQYYGLIGRNTPLRVNVRPHLQVGDGLDIVDTFTRTVSDTNWGVSDSGKSWQPAGGATAPSQYAVTGTAATAKILANATTTGCYLDECAWVDFDAAVTFTVPLATGGSIVCGIASHVDTTTLVAGPYVRAEMDVTNTVRLRAFNLANTAIGVHANTGLVHTGAAWRMRVRTAGRHLMARVWDPAGTEPTTWQLSVEDTTASYDPGSLFLFAQTLTGNTNVKPLTVTFDDFEVEAVEPRFTGEVASWPPRWTPGGHDVWVPVEANGILRRLNQGTAPARSSMVRFALGHATPPVAYWPLDDGPLATQGVPLAGTPAFDLFSDLAPDQYFGQGKLAAWLDNGVAMHGIDTLFGYVNMDPAQTAWCLDWVRAGEESSAETLMIIRTGSIEWQVRFNPSTELIKVTNPSSVTTTASATAVFDGAMHHIRFQVIWVNPSITWTAYIDGASVLTNTYVPASGLSESVVWVNFQDLLNHDTDLTIAHVAVWADPTSSGALLPNLADTVAAVFGHDGEAAATRIVRLCAEEDVPLRIPGVYNLDLTTSEACGVQRTATFLDLLRAAEASDGGVLYEPRDFVGLTYRMRSQMYNQTPRLELDYTGDGHVAPPLEPTDDDQLTRNDVTVKRAFGSSGRAEQTTGPLSTSAPPDGVGRYDTSVELDLETDARAEQQAGWRIHLGTVDEPRFPKVNTNLANMAGHGERELLADVIRLDVGDRLTVTNPPDWLPPRTINQLGQGFDERLTQFEWGIGVNCSPATPWAIATVESDDEFEARLDSGSSTLDADATDTATTIQVAATGLRWVDSATFPDDFPFDINVAGVRLTVTAITGTTSPQTFTVLRSVDGFDIDLSEGATVQLWAPTYIGL